MSRRFTLKFKTEEVEVEDVNGIIKEYKVTELSGPVLCKYMDEMQSRTKVAKDGSVSMTSFDGMYTALLKHALLDSDNKLVSVSEMESWPAGVQKGLFEIAQEMSGLTTVASEEAKND